MAPTGRYVWRDFVSDGIPSSGKNRVSKKDARDWSTYVESLVAAVIAAGGKLYTSLAAMNADLTPDAHTPALVIGDPTVANNGLYVKVSVAGAGSWSRVGDIPGFQFVRAENVGAGTANAIVATSALPISNDVLVYLPIAETNTATPVTVSFNGTAALTIKTVSGNDPVAAGLVAGMVALGVVSGSTFRLASDQTSAAVLAAAEDAAERAEIAAASIDLPPVAANRMLVDNAAGTARESKGFSDVRALLHPLRGFNADGVINDSANFTSLEANYSGNVIDLQGKTYLVTSIPTANMYVNGFWKIGSLVYDALEWSSFIASASDTGGIETAYSGGTLPLLAPSGRSTSKTIGLLWSQNSRSEFVRAVNVGSIYVWAKGNVSGNYSARNCLAWVPQSVNMASEECWVWGGFRGVNLGSFTSGCEGESNFNLGTRGSYATGRNAGNIASTGARAGRGGGIRLTVTPIAGAINTACVAIDQPGARYQVGDSLVFYDRSGNPTTVAVGTITAVNATGGATAAIVTTDGVGYSSRVDATVDNGTGDFSANIACSGFTETTGEASAVIASLGGAAAYVKASGKNSAVIASEVGSEASGNMSVVLASTAGIASGQISAAIAANNSQATAQESVVFGRRTINPTTRELAGGENNTGSPLSSNRKWSISNVTGVFKSVTTFSASGTFADFGEYFENRDRGVIPYGTIVMLKGGKLAPWDGTGRIVGVVSATIAFVGNDSDFQWQGRYLKNEVGEIITKNIPDPDWTAEIPDPNWPKYVPNPLHPTLDQVLVSSDDPDQSFIFKRKGRKYRYAVASTPTIPNPDAAPMVSNPTAQGMITVQIENPEYDPSLEVVPRSNRREEWTPVGFAGQVFVVLDQQPEVEDVIEGPRGGKSLEVMEITTPYTEEKGYCVVKCYI